MNPLDFLFDKRRQTSFFNCFRYNHLFAPILQSSCRMLYFTSSCLWIM